MIASLVDRVVRSQRWLDPTGAFIQKIVGGIYRVATQSRTKRRLKPKRSGRVGKDLINARQVACSRADAHPRLLTPLRSQLHRRSCSAPQLHQERWDSQSGPGQSA